MPAPIAIQDRFDMIDGCTTYGELLAVAKTLGRTPLPQRTPFPMRFVPNGDERVCLTCRGWGEIHETHEETDGGIVECWKCRGAGTLP